MSVEQLSMLPASFSSGLLSTPEAYHQSCRVGSIAGPANTVYSNHGKPCRIVLVHELALYMYLFVESYNHLDEPSHPPCFTGEMWWPLS
jgi:hypothetical protein